MSRRNCEVRMWLSTKSWLKSHIGQLRLVDILLKVSLLSQYSTSPREGHFEWLLHILAFLHMCPKSTIYLSPQLPLMDFGAIQANKSTSVKYVATLKSQCRMPKAQGRSLTVTVYVDASHWAHKATRRSHTGYVPILNRAPILWHSKCQQTVETSTFSMEFIASKVCLEAIKRLCFFKLRCFRIPMEKREPTYVLSDNGSVVKNTTNVESTLNAKPSTITCHHCQGSVTADIIIVAHISTRDNSNDCFTKRL